MTAVKYCGGCNPRYDRKEAKRRLEIQAGNTLEYAEPERHYEVLYVICGCDTACVNLSVYSADRIVKIVALPEIKQEQQGTAAV